MKKRAEKFARKNILILPFTACLLFACGDKNEVSSPQSLAENVAAEQLLTTVEKDAEKVKLVEVFWYGCSHCYNLEPLLKKWLKTKVDDVDFVRVPAAANPLWSLHARAYYAAEELGIVEKIHPRIFAAIHKNGMRLQTKNEIAEFFKLNGVDKSSFEKAWSSKAVDAKVEASKKLVRKHKLTSVPALIVADKHLAGSKTSQSPAAVLAHASSLIAKEKLH